MKELITILTGASVLFGCSTFGSATRHVVGHCGVSSSPNAIVDCEAYQVRCAKYGREKTFFCNYIIK